MVPTATAAPAKASDKAKDSAQPKAPIPKIAFTAAAKEHAEDIFDVSKPLTAAVQNLGTFDVPAFGFLRGIFLKVDATGGTGTVAVMKADAPWSVIGTVEIDDTNGQPFYGPLTGYQAYLVHKWLSPVPSDPTKDEDYAAPSTAGNFSYLLRLPVEISPRDGLGSLENQNSASTYKVKITLADSASVYATVPTTLPTVRVQAWADEWTEPLSTDPLGRPQETEPPALGVTQEFSVQPININAGQQNPRLTRVGNTIRAWLLETRDATGARTDGILADPVSVMWDSRVLDQAHQSLIKHRMKVRYPDFTRDVGIYVYDFCHDFSGRAGMELRDGWLPTSTGSRIEFQGSYLAAGTLNVLTNDILSFAGQL